MVISMAAGLRRPEMGYSEAEEMDMPIITFAGGRLTGEQKAQLAEQVTEAAHKVTDIHKDAFVVIIRDGAQENVGFSEDRREPRTSLSLSF